MSTAKQTARFIGFALVWGLAWVQRPEIVGARAFVGSH
jgi:hypothetical protein